MNQTQTIFRKGRNAIQTGDYNNIFDFRDYPTKEIRAYKTIYRLSNA